MNPRVKKNPDGFVIMIDRHALSEAGNRGLVKDELVASRLCDAVAAACPGRDVQMFKVFTLTGA